MDEQDLIEKIRAANESFAERILSGIHDIQYDDDADMLYITFGSSGDAFSVGLDTTPDEAVYLRVESDTHKVVGLDILNFRQVFLANHPDAREAFDPLFNFLGRSDWRFQMKLPEGEISLLLPAQAPVRYLGSYIPKAAPDLVPA